MEKLLDLRHAVSGQIDNFVLLIDDKIARLLPLNPHDGIHLGQVFHVLAARQLSRQDVAGLINFGGFAALAGNNQRRPRLVNQNRVHLIDNRVMQTAQHQLVLVDCHVVAQVIKAQLIVRDIGDVRIVRLAALLGRHAVQHHAAGKAHEAENLSHLLRITFGQIIVDRNNMYALAVQRVQIRRERRHQRFALAGAHLRDASLMQNDAADDLYMEGFHTQHAPVALADGRKSFRKQVIQCLPVSKTPAEFICFAAQLLVRKGLHRIAQRFDSIHQRLDALQLMLAVRAEDLIHYSCHINLNRLSPAPRRSSRGALPVPVRAARPLLHKSSPARGRKPSSQSATSHTCRARCRRSG